MIDFNKMYWAFESRYNKYPVQMSRQEAFRRAVDEGLIDEDTYRMAKEYFGSLWNYVGD